MKKIKLILVILFTLLFLNVHAQVFIGGDFGISSSSHKASTNTSKLSNQSGFGFNLSPLFGKFVSNKVALGIMTDITSSSSKDGIEHSYHSESFGIGAYPFVRYYFVQWNKLSLFAMGTTGISYSKSKNYTDGTIESKSDGLSYSINVHPGISYTLTDKISLETEIGLLKIGYRYDSSKSGTTKYHSSNFNFSGSSYIGSFSLGAIYKF